MSFYEIPAVTVGAGTQPSEEDGARLNYQEMPDDMATFSMPSIPEPEEVRHLQAAINRLSDCQLALDSYQVGEPETVFDLTWMSQDDLELVGQILGEGEVSVLFNRTLRAEIQESVLAGVWRVRYQDATGKVYKDTLEVATIPGLIRDATFIGAQTQIKPVEGGLPTGVQNAPPLLTELNEKSATYQPGQPPHVINLTLLPQTEEDLNFLAQQLGQGSVTILSRGYGNCRITSTHTQSVWWVQYFNSQEANILNTLEVVDVPAVACAAQEDIRDSADRLKEILEIYR